jgi:hypothetical protein
VDLCSQFVCMTIVSSCCINSCIYAEWYSLNGVMGGWQFHRSWEDSPTQCTVRYWKCINYVHKVIKVHCYKYCMIVIIKPFTELYKIYSCPSFVTLSDFTSAVATFLKCEILCVWSGAKCCQRILESRIIMHIYFKIVCFFSYKMNWCACCLTAVMGVRIVLHQCCSSNSKWPEVRLCLY